MLSFLTLYVLLSMKYTHAALVQLVEKDILATTQATAFFTTPNSIPTWCFFPILSLHII